MTENAAQAVEEVKEAVAETAEAAAETVGDVKEKAEEAAEAALEATENALAAAASALTGETAEEAPAADGENATGTYTFFNKTGEKITEFYLIDNTTEEQGENYAGEEGFAAEASMEIIRTVSRELVDAGYSMTVSFKTESGYEAQFATLHIEEAQIELLAADAMTGATPIAFVVPAAE